MLVAWVYDFNNWKEKFIEYLEADGKKTSVAKDYAGRIRKILEEENITIQQLHQEIDQWIVEYKTGKRADVNKKRHYAPSSALIKFKAFAPSLRKAPAQKPLNLMDMLSENNGTDFIY